MSDAFIANELETRLREHLPHAILPTKKLELSREGVTGLMVSGSSLYQAAEFDGVIAPLVLLEPEEVTAFFKEVHRILAPNGFFLFSTLGNDRPHALETIGDALLKAGFQLPVVDRETLQVHYDNMNILRQDLELSGLSEEFIRVEKKSSHDIIATLDVIYGYALGAVIQTSSVAKIEIPIESIKIRKPI